MWELDYPDMGTAGPDSQIRPVVECPYCDEKIFRNALYGHVSATQDEAHGPRGTVPDDYEDIEPNIVEYVHVRPREKKAPKEERVLCRYCYKTFNGKHGLEVHIGMRAGDEDHPDDATVEDALVPLSMYNSERTDEQRPETSVEQNPEPDPDGDDDLEQYRSKLKSMTQDPSERPTQATESVPAAPLLELLDGLRRREGESSAYVTAARMLQEVLEEHGALSS